MPTHFAGESKTKIFFAASLITSFAFLQGCASTSTSNTARTGTEQVLISKAIDRAMTTVQFGNLSGYKVFVDEKYLDSVDKGYLVGSIRHRILQAGGALATAADQADIVMEVRSGGVGTDTQESFIGIPALGMPGLPIELPEIKLANRSTQMGTAKIGLVCYDPQTGRGMGQGGETSALTHNNDTYIMGVGPFRSGAVLEERENSVGFNGVGGSFLTNPLNVAKNRRIPIVNQAPMPMPEPEGPTHIATAPEASNIK